MMSEMILRLLREADVYAWEYSAVRTRGWEFYFIRHALDQHRVKNVEHITLKIYQLIDDGTYLGSASGEIAPTATEEEVRALIGSLAYRATLVKNRPYTLHPPRTAEPAETKRTEVSDMARAFLDTMRSLPETAGEDINSYEIFVSEKTRRLITSAGVDIEESYPDSMVEVVVNARNEGHEIELCREYRSGTCDAAGLKRDVMSLMRYGRDRLLAKPTPMLDAADVLFSGEDARSIYTWFAGRLNTAMVCRKMSDWEPGKPVCGEFRGDRLNLYALRTLPNSSLNRLYDAEGAPIRDLALIEDGVAKNYVGERMFSAYMGLEDTFIPTNYAVSGGSRTEEELRRGRYLEVVDFSDFQVDRLTGDVFGEIRLAYWHDGETVTPVSGGSVSGSMLELAGNMLLSKETAQYNNWRIPAATLLRGVTVTGTE